MARETIRRTRAGRYRPFMVIYTIISPIIVRQAIGWFTRDRSAGSLVLDVTLPLARRHPQLYCVYLLPTVILAVFGEYHGSPPP